MTNKAPAHSLRKCGRAQGSDACVVLVVEDEAASRTGTERLLAEAGLDVIAVSTPSAALDVARKLRIDVLVTDLRLPEQRGDRLAREILGLQPRVAVIYVSGELPSPTCVGGPFLEKPIEIDVLVDTIAAARREAS